MLRNLRGASPVTGVEKDRGILRERQRKLKSPRSGLKQKGRSKNSEPCSRQRGQSKNPDRRSLQRGDRTHAASGKGIEKPRALQPAEKQSKNPGGCSLWRKESKDRRRSRVPEKGVERPAAPRAPEREIGRPRAVEKEGKREPNPGKWSEGCGGRRGKEDKTSLGKGICPPLQEKREIR